MTGAEFEAWLRHQEQASIAGLAACLSPVTLTMARPGFGQTIGPLAGSTVASPNVPAGPQEPDYFFHWLRDAALFFEAARVLWRRGDRSQDWIGLYRGYVGFSLRLNALSGQALVEDPSYRARVAPDYTQFLRDPAELSALTPDRVPGDVRFNPDGTLDPIRWSRPQHDGPALRALNALRFWADGETGADAAALITADLDYTLRHLMAPSIDLWEERLGRHFYTEAAQAAALEAGAEWAASGGDAGLSARCADAAALARTALDLYRTSDGTLLASLPPETKTLDIATTLAAIHCDHENWQRSSLARFAGEGRGEGPYGRTAGSQPLSPEIPARDRPPTPALSPDGGEGVEPDWLASHLRTLDAFERQCVGDYPINHDRPQNQGIALGRYRGDHYVTRGPWYLATFAAAELRYRAGLIEAGDASLRAAAITVPPSGALSEQFDPATGRQSSARDLGWSHAAFITALAARRGNTGI